MPFGARRLGGVRAAAAIPVSVLATVDPARNATCIVLAEILRYE